MVNSHCDMSCPHCDLPPQYNKKYSHLTELNWEKLLYSLQSHFDPKVIAVAGKEPLLDFPTRKKTRKILEVAHREKIRCGFITNGMHLNDFLLEIPEVFHFDYLDISIEGLKETDSLIRGAGHFEKVETFLNEKRYPQYVDSLFISTTLTELNFQPEQFRCYLEWLCLKMAPPNLALLMFYPNQNTDIRLALREKTVDSIIRIASDISPHFNQLFIEVFPGSIPNLKNLIETNILPGQDNVLRDESGIQCGHISENLFIRYLTPHDLLMYHLRIGPDGSFLSPEGLESSDFQKGKLGSFEEGTISLVLKNTKRRLKRLTNQVPQKCKQRNCYNICMGTNNRCPYLLGKEE